MNKFNGAGRLTRDIELREVGETKVGKFGIAINRKFKKDGQPECDFINCVVWGKTAEIMSQYLSKGNMVCISGRIQCGSYEKDGVKVFTTAVVVEEFTFVESKKDSASSNTDSMPFSDEGTEDLPF